jgi:valyl-tRNA synthetase
LEPYPRPKEEPDLALEESFESVQRLVRAVRNLRATTRLGEGPALTALVKPLREDARGLIESSQATVSRLANLEALELVAERPPRTLALFDPAFELYVDLGRYLDLRAERARIEKERSGYRKKLEQTAAKLANQKFLSGAPPEVVDAEKAKERELKELIAKLDRLEADYESLK